jgi:hypothetical protein
MGKTNLPDGSGFKDASSELALIAPLPKNAMSEALRNQRLYWHPQTNSIVCNRISE